MGKMSSLISRKGQSIRLDQELYKGHTQPCETFDNKSLTEDEIADFFC